MDDTIKHDIAALTNQSDNIAKQVQLKNWDSVELMTQQRQISLEHFFKTPVSPKYAKSVEKMIRTILDSDRQLIDFITAEKKKTFSKFSAMQNNTKANKTYGTIVSLDCS